MIRDWIINYFLLQIGQLGTEKLINLPRVSKSDSELSVLTAPHALPDPAPFPKGGASMGLIALKG